MKNEFDVIVLGLGAMGSAASYQFAKRGKRVLGIDRFTPPHTFGSSHGDTRITRQAIGEGANYSPFVLRAHKLWREIERETGRRLFVECGGLIIAGAQAQSARKPGFFEATVAAAKEFNVPHEILSGDEVRRRFPQFALREGERGYYEPGAGYVRPEECIRAQLELAAKLGAELHYEEKAVAIKQTGDGATVETERGRYSAKHLIVSAGAGAPDLLGERWARPLTVFRQVLYWFEPREDPAQFAPGRFPVFIWNLPGKQDIYGFPIVEGSSGVKIATEQYQVPTTIDTVNRDVSAEETAQMYREYVAANFPRISDSCVKSKVCLYTATPDSNFIIDRLPGQDRIIVASPCSGHGFKHSAAIGESLAELVTKGRSRLDLSPFGFHRFG